MYTIETVSLDFQAHALKNAVCRGCITPSRTQLEIKHSEIIFMSFLMLAIYMTISKGREKAEAGREPVGYTFSHINILFYHEIKFEFLSKYHI